MLSPSMKSTHCRASSGCLAPLQDADELDLLEAAAGHGEVARGRLGRLRVGKEDFGRRAGRVTDHQGPIALAAAAAELPVVGVLPAFRHQNVILPQVPPEVEVGVVARLAERCHRRGRKASPGDEVAGFSTTSRPLYAGSVRSRKVFGRGIPLSAKYCLVVVDRHIAEVDRQEALLGSSFRSAGMPASAGEA